jgi:spermidine/putrescine transport system permease protein
MRTDTLGLPVRSLRAYLWLVYAFLYLPIAVVVLLSFNEAGLPTAWSGFSLKWYGALASSPKILSAAGNSLVVAAAVTVVSTVLGTLLAFAVEARGRKRGAGLLDGILAMPLIIPDIVLAIALLSFFTALQWTLGLYSIILAHVTFDLAYVCMVVRTRLKHFDFALVEASADLGAGSFRTFLKIVMPSILPGVVAAALLAFTLSVDEFIIAYFTAGAGSASTTLPMQIYAMIRFGVTPEINALATVTLAATILLLFVGQRLAGEKGAAT